MARTAHTYAGKGGFLHWLALWELGSWITSSSVAVIKYGDCGNVWKRSLFGLSSGGLDSTKAAGSRSRKLRAHTLNCKSKAESVNRQ